MKWVPSCHVPVRPVWGSNGENICNSLPSRRNATIVRQPGIFRFQECRLRLAILRSKGIDYFEKRELIEIGVAGANSRDAVFAHKNGGVRVVEQIAGKVRQ